MYKLFLFSIILLLPVFVFSSGAFVVNTTMDSTQRDPQMARDAQGNYIVVWNTVQEGDAGDILYSLFDASDQRLGGEVLVNTNTSGEQEKPAVSMNKAGDFIITWASHGGVDSLYDIKARFFKQGVPAGPEFLVNKTIPFSQTNPDVAIDNNGNFAIVWESWFQDGSDRGVFARLYDSDGISRGEPFQVNTTTEYSQARPAVKYFEDGSFIVIWESWMQDVLTETGYGIYGQLYSAEGARKGAEFRINTYTNDCQWFGDVETFADNSFIVVWNSWQQDGDKGGVYLQKFNSDAQKTGSEKKVNETTTFCQWLPCIKKLNEDKIAVVWSSWKQDGSREGIFARFFDIENEKNSFELQVNDYTDSFQWEPDMIPVSDNEAIIAWSNWGQFNKDYEIMAKHITPVFPQGYYKAAEYEHPAGKSTMQFKVHVTDSSALTGDTYEISFADIKSASFKVNIKNLNNGSNVVSDILINKGEGVFYLTQSFDGVAVQIIPELDFALDFERSYFKNESGSNLIQTLSYPTLGTALLAPIDAALIWGNADTLQNGQYASPLDTASGYYGNVLTPFKIIDIESGKKLGLFVIENASTKNGKWDVTEKIDIITPPPYQEISSNTHAEINTVLPAEKLTLPAPGDIYYIYTNRPVKEEDRFQFTTNSGFSTGINSLQNRIKTYRLEQNYPNPFNPVTTIPYYLPQRSRIVINIYNILGERVVQLANGFMNAGNHKIVFDGSQFSSGMYFVTLQAGQKSFARRVLLIK